MGVGIGWKDIEYVGLWWRLTTDAERVGNWGWGRLW